MIVSNESLVAIFISRPFIYLYFHMSLWSPFSYFTVFICRPFHISPFSYIAVFIHCCFQTSPFSYLVVSDIPGASCPAETMRWFLLKVACLWWAKERATTFFLRIFSLFCLDVYWPYPAFDAIMIKRKKGTGVNTYASTNHDDDELVSPLQKSLKLDGRT